MAFVTNAGSSAINPYGATDRYILLAHPAVSDTLLLNEFVASGEGYKPSQITGLLSLADRTLSSFSAVQASYKKLQWTDLAFVMSAAQAKLFEQLLLAQTPAQPVTLSDRIANPASPTTKLVVVDSPDGASVYGNLSQYLVQFNATEV
jgi:hypothetical protein